MPEFSELIHELCSNLGVQREPDGDLFVLEAQGHFAVLSSCRLPSGEEGVRLQISVGTLPPATDGSTIDALRLLHHLNHQARTTSPWRIFLAEDDLLMMHQTCLLNIGAEGAQQVLVDGMQRLEALQTLLQDWLPATDAVAPPSPSGPHAHIIFG